MPFAEEEEAASTILLIICVHFELFSVCPTASSRLG